MRFKLSMYSQMFLVSPDTVTEYLDAQLCVGKAASFKETLRVVRALSSSST
jgi:hypothetical protein